MPLPVELINTGNLVILAWVNEGLILPAYGNLYPSAEYENS